ncbi:MAG: 8-amino-7-oxononanoate synthase [Solirubrobacteraceae bacterium]|nr:8-amino-7-oxononanoate synthase [Solirubrobacteraceae bacterium]
MDELSDRLEDLKDQGLYRRLRLVSGPQGPRVVLDGTPVLLLCSNNYLGLSDHPRIREAAADAAMRWGVGAGASRLVSGSMTIHGRLEARLAAFKGTESAILFGSGYLANVGVVQALGEESSLICSDELNHASIVEGCRTAKAPTFVYRHGDLEHLEWGLRTQVPQGAAGKPLIVTDSVFSMDGDIAPLAGIAELARRHGARTVVDEAHGTGCVGPGGRGAVAAAGLEGEFDVIVGTLGKALGAYGAFAAGTLDLTRFLINRSRPLIFSTAPAPPVVAGALAALELLESSPERVERLQQNAASLHTALRDEGMTLQGPPSHIVPIVVGEADTAMAMCERLLERRVFAQAIRPPTVPEGTSRLRITVQASHTPQELRRAAQAIAEVARELGLPIGDGPARPSITKSDDSFGEWSAAPARVRTHVATPSPSVRSTGVSAPSPSSGAAGTTGFFDVEAIDPSMVRASRGVGSVRF